VFSAEFKFDERDGLFKLLEVNARPWWYVDFADRCGVDVCGMAFRDALGEEIEPVTGYKLGGAESTPASIFRARSESAARWP